MKVSLRNAFALTSMLVGTIFTAIDAEKRSFVKVEPNRKLKGNHAPKTTMGTQAIPTPTAPNATTTSAKMTTKLFGTASVKTKGQKAQKGSGAVIADKQVKKGKGKSSKGGQVILINAVDSTGNCPADIKFELIEISTQTCVQTVNKIGNSCACTLTVPPDGNVQDFSIKIQANGMVCSGSIGSSCVQDLTTDRTEFRVNLVSTTSKHTSSSSSSTSSSTSTFTSTSISSSTTVNYHYTSVIVVQNASRNCISQANVNLINCETQEIVETFTTTDTNCATSFAIPSAETHFCYQIVSENYTCDGSCVSGAIEIPKPSVNIDKVEVTMHSVLGSICLNLAQATVTEIKEKVTYSLIDATGVTVSTVQSDCHGVTFSSVTKGTYSITYRAISGYTCAGVLVNGYCMIKNVSCIPEETTNITHIIECETCKPNALPTKSPFKLTDKPLHEITHATKPPATSPLLLIVPPPMKEPTENPTKNLTWKPVVLLTRKPTPKPVEKTNSWPTKDLIEVPPVGKKNCSITTLVNGTPISGVHVDIGFLGTAEQSFALLTNSLGQCSFTPESSRKVYVTVTPPSGFQCQKSCSFQIDTQMEETTDITVVLIEVPSTAVITVTMGGQPCGGKQIDFFVTGELGKVIGSCTTEANGACTFSPPKGTDVSYIATITPSEGEKCETCSVEMTLKPGSTVQNTLVLVEVPSTAVISVTMGGQPCGGKQIDFFVTGELGKVIGSCTTEANGACTFSPPKGTDVSYIATITPSEGEKCETCSVEMTLKPGSTVQNTLVLVEVPSTAVISVTMGGQPCGGKQIDFFVTGELGKVIGSCTTEANGACTFSPPKGTDVSYIATITPSEGEKCETCSVEMTLKPGSTVQNTLVLVEVPSTAVISVTMGGQPCGGKQIDFFVTGELGKVIGSCTTEANGACTFSPPKGTDVSYIATITPSEGEKCETCSVEMTLKPGSTVQNTLVLVEVPSTAVISVTMGGQPCGGKQIDFFVTGELGKVIGSCTTEANGACTFSPPKGTDVSYIATITPSEGEKCETCSVEMTLKPGSTVQNTLVLVEVPSTAVISVTMGGQPCGGKQIDFFVTGELGKVIGSCTTEANGACTFSPPKGTDVSYIATITPSEGTSCGVCSADMNLVPGETGQYNLELTPNPSTLVVSVEYQGISVPGAQINFSNSTSQGSVIQSCTTSNTNAQCSMTTQTTNDVKYMATIVLPPGYSCPIAGCSASFTLIPGKTKVYTFSVIPEQAQGVVTVAESSGDCVAGTVVEIFDSSKPNFVLERFTTKSGACNATFSTSNVDIVYLATVTPPNNSYQCSGDFSSSCSATFQVVFIEITMVHCVLVSIVPPPMKAPTKLPTTKPTLKPTKLPTEKPTFQPTMLPTKLPTKTPTSNPTKLPTEKPTSQPTMLPAKKLTWKPTTKTPTKCPMVIEKAVVPSIPLPGPDKGKKATASISNDYPTKYRTERDQTPPKPM